MVDMLPDSSPLSKAMHFLRRSVTQEGAVLPWLLREVQGLSHAEIGYLEKEARTR